MSHYLQEFIHSRWCRISSINSTGNAVPTTPFGENGSTKRAAGKNNDLFNLYAQKSTQDRFPAKLSIKPLGGDFIYFFEFSPGMLRENSIPVLCYAYLLFSYQTPHQKKKNQLRPPFKKKTSRTPHQSFSNMII